jgi:AraC-like DNA-binding protein
MKVFPFKIPKTKDETLIYQRDEEIILYDKLHQHEEIQISYIERGEGTIIIGDTISDYKDGDILIFGSNLPHVLRSEPRNPDETPYSLVHSIFFTPESFGELLFNFSEFKSIQPLFNDIKNGCKIDTNTEKIKKLILKFSKGNNFNRFILFFKIIKLLTKSEKESLSSFRYNKLMTDTEGKRMQIVFEFVMNNFHSNICLEEIASIANMSKNAFCRYFKTRTNKTFFQFLIELRIEKSAKLLLKQKELPVIEIAELSGFNNISNFNRKFKEIKGVSPLSYRKEYVPKN